MIPEKTVTTTCKLALILTFCWILLSCNPETPDRDPVFASSDFYAISSNTNALYEMDSSISYGYADLLQQDSTVTMTIVLSGLPPNSVHAVHIHQGDCAEPGSHWNMGEADTVRFCDQLSMGVPWGRPMAGDIGNIAIGADSTGSLTLESTFWELGTGTTKDIVGRTIVIHDSPEDFMTECMPNHGSHPHFNSKIGCGSIQLTTSR